MQILYQQQEVSAYSELYCLFFIALSYYVDLKFGVAKYIPIGILFALSTLVNQGSVLFLIPFLIKLFANGNIGQILKLLTGFIVPYIIVISLYINNNLLDVFIATYITIPLEYTSAQYSNFYEDYKKKILELKKLKSENISNEIVKSENIELKELIEDYTLTKNKILAKVIVDHKSPFLRTIIINKGTADRIKIGTNIFDKSYLVGRVIEVNYKSSRVLLLSDLNSNVPVSIIPGNIQAIVTGNGINSGKIKYTKDNLTGKLKMRLRRTIANCDAHDD